MICNNKNIESPESSFEKAFFPTASFQSTKAIKWLEYESEKRNAHIHHLRRGHGGERYIGNLPVDGYDPKTKTVCQFHGCHWYGCLRCYPEDRQSLVYKDVTIEKAYQTTLSHENKIKKAGYKLVTLWEHDQRYWPTEVPKKYSYSYLHAIVYDFESYFDNKAAINPTVDLTLENNHIPISVSVGSTLEREPIHLCNTDPKELIEEFLETIEDLAQNIREEMRSKFLPEDFEMLSKKQRILIQEWIDQVPVLGFNSGKYDLNLITNHFVGAICWTTVKSIKVDKKGNTIMFLNTPGFKILDIINYLGPGTSYDSWAKAYDCQYTKSWFPYEWFDSVDKLNHPGLPDYPNWYSKLKNGLTLSLEEWKSCKEIFK